MRRNKNGAVWRYIYGRKKNQNRERLAKTLFFLGNFSSERDIKSRQLSVQVYAIIGMRRTSAIDVWTRGHGVDGREV